MSDIKIKVPDVKLLKNTPEHKIARVFATGMARSIVLGTETIEDTVNFLKSDKDKILDKELAAHYIAATLEAEEKPAMARRFLELYG